MIDRRGFGVLVGAILVLSTATAEAQVRPLRWDPPVDGTVTIAGAVLAVAFVVLQPEIAPARCRWCDANEFDSAARNAFLWRDPRAANLASDITGLALAPIAAFGLDALAASHDGSGRTVPLDALLITEAVVLALDATEITKVLVGRGRPFLRAHPDDPTPPSSDDNLSFFSGHSAEAAALAAASGTVATMRGYRWAPITWAVGGALAAGTAYLRIAADEHWLTDVLVGLAVGVGVGFAVPYVFHRPAEGLQP